jgi:mono/diheme cytochrome c family protein
MRTHAIPAAVVLVASLTAARGAEPPADYAKSIKPILTAHCTRCHGPDEQKSDLRLDSLDAILTGGKLGPAVVRGKSAKSVLLQAIKGASTEVVAMPPVGEGEPLSADEMKLVERWIDGGAK